MINIGSSEASVQFSYLDSNHKTSSSNYTKLMDPKNKPIVTIKGATSLDLLKNQNRCYIRMYSND